MKKTKPKLRKQKLDAYIGFRIQKDIVVKLKKNNVDIAEQCRELLTYLVNMDVKEK